MKIFIPDVRGYLEEAEAVRLSELAEGKRVIEVGSFAGKSTICMAQLAKMVVSVDPHDHPPPPTTPEFVDNIWRHGLWHKVVMVRSRIEAAADFWPHGWFDLAFLDADHYYPSTLAQLAILKRLVRPDGLIACHDYATDWHGVTVACDESFPGITPERVGSLAIYRVPG